MKKIITGPCLLAYVYVFEARAVVAGGDEKYSALAVISKDDKATLSKIENAIAEAKKEGVARFGAEFGKDVQFNNPLKDGDINKPGDPIYKNSYFLNVNSKRKPGVVDKNVSPILDPSEVYSGNLGRISATAFPYCVGASTGISFGLNNVQILEAGTPLSRKARPEDDFGVFEGDDILD